MKKEELFELVDKVQPFIQNELKNETIIDVATAVIFALGVLASEGCDSIVLPETICRHALTNLDLMKGGLYDNLKNS